MVMSLSLRLHARPSHRLTTPRLILRSGIPSDAEAVCSVRSEPLNNLHGGVHEPNLTADVQAKRIESQEGSTAKGENAWMQIILKPEFADQVAEKLAVEDGVLIGMTGFNSFLRDSETGLLFGDTGAMVDYRYTRKGYALEAMQAVFEYGFNELGCHMMVLDTHEVNKPWRRLMKVMGLEDFEEIKRSETEEDEAWYKFDREEWEKAKKGLKGKGKWYL